MTHNNTDLINKMMIKFKVTTLVELGKKINISQPSISLWKKNNHSDPIKNKCIELGIYDEIFDVRKNININKNTINCKFFNFNRRSLAYFYYLLKTQKINNSYEYSNYQIIKNEESKFKSFITDFFLDLSNNMISLSAYRRECHEYIELLFNNDEIDFIFQNKEVFISSIYFIITKK